MVISAFATARQATADEPYLSPRAKANQLHYAPAGSSMNNPDLVKDRPVGNAKAEIYRSRNQIATAGVSTATTASVGYQVTGSDGVAASPKLREQINERSGTPVMVAPLK